LRAYPSIARESFGVQLSLRRLNRGERDFKWIVAGAVTRHLIINWRLCSSLASSCSCVCASRVRLPAIRVARFPQECFDRANAAAALHRATQRSINIAHPWTRRATRNDGLNLGVAEQITGADDHDPVLAEHADGDRDVGASSGCSLARSAGGTMLLLIARAS
jgi:hypothetical protein